MTVCCPGAWRSITAAALVAALAGPALGQTSFVAFESGQVRPVAISPDGNQLFVLNTPDNRLEIFDVTPTGLSHTDSVPVGVEPVAVAVRGDNEVWVINHLSDSVSIVDLAASPPRVAATLLVGDEPRDIVFAGTGGNRAFITTAHRGTQRFSTTIATTPLGCLGPVGCTPGAGDPQFTTPGVGRADVWVFDALDLGTEATLGGRPIRIVTLFADTPRALAVSPDGGTVYAAAFHSGNQTTTVREPAVCDGFGAAGPCNVAGETAPGGNPGPSDNAFGNQAPETGLIVKFNRATDTWEDELGRDWNQIVEFNLPDFDVFAISANDLPAGAIDEFAHVGTILFNMAVNPINGKIYVTNTESPNHVRFEGAGNHGGSTVQGHLSETRITVIDPGNSSVDAQHLNQHIDYTKLHTAVPDLVDPDQINHSLATPLQLVVSGDGSKIYMAAFGSSKIGVFDTADIEDANFETNFDPTVESANYISVGGGPSGLVLDESNNRLYVLTRFDNSISSIPLPAGSGTPQTLALHNPEPQSVIDGRPFLYDAVATSGNGESSCASCHIFGDNDNLAWDLGDPDNPLSVNSQPAVIFPQSTFHPNKGPMTTQTLRGLSTHGGLHWRGDRVDGFFGTDPCTDPLPGSPCSEEHSFMNFIVAFEGLVGKDGTLSEADMQKFTDFALQLALPPNPVVTVRNELSPAQLRGKELFSGPVTDIILPCSGCHGLDPAQGFFGSNSLQTFDGGLQNVKVPHVRNAYTKVGMFGISGVGLPNFGDQIRGYGVFKDGSVDTLTNFVSAPAFSTTPAQEADLVQYMLGFESDLAPMVAQQVTLNATNGPGGTDQRIDEMVERAGTPFDSLFLGGTVTECDLIAKGTVAGSERGWMRQPNGIFLDDLGDEISETDLRALATTEGPLTFTCVPPGSGMRSGIERDGDTLLDGVETNTGNFINASNTGTDPGLADTDGDGFDDGVEVLEGTDPTSETSFPGSGIGLPALPSLGILFLAGVIGALGIRLSRSSGRGVRSA